MTDADFARWEGDQFEYEFQSWLDRNEELLRRIAARLNEAVTRIVEWFKNICCKMWEQLRVVASAAADALRHLWEAYHQDWPELSSIRVSGLARRQRRGKRRPPPVRNLGATAVRGPHTFRRY